MARVNEDTVAIVGNGAAAAECIRALRERGHLGEVHLFTSSAWPTYNPMLTTYYVAGKIGFDGLFPYGNGDFFYRQHDVRFHPGSLVAALDAEKKTLSTRPGFQFRYDQCLVATGASPVLPRIEGMASDRVYAMRTVEDALRLRRAVEMRPKKALVIGASMVGIKLVELFHEAGMEVCLADLAPHIFPTAASPECARVIEDRLAAMGIALRFGAGIQGIEETAAGVRAHFDGGGPGEEADLLVMCIGVRANIGFVDRSQVEVKQGVLVDEQMRTSAPGLYAAGDVAQGRDLLTGENQVIGLWASARCQGRTAGTNMAGVVERLPGNILHNITHFMGMDFVGIGTTRNYDRMEKQYDGKRFVQLFWRNDLLVGANLLGSYEEAGILKQSILKSLMQGGLAPLNSISALEKQKSLAWQSASPAERPVRGQFPRNLRQVTGGRAL